MALEPIPIAWFKTDPSHRRHGNTHIERYFQLSSDGVISVLDMTRMKFANQKSFGGTPVTMMNSTREEWLEKIIEFKNKIK